ncbi:MAG: 16S rRNA (uracil(1498)-N(3))-methyltransferase [Coriobacteriia bacterium]|nr:16S rRNA (uracil(1498)-N(3))-methyltransferase [Coriobacteriia bacterium]
MTLHRFFADGPLRLDDGVLPLSAADAHHLRDVLRLGSGDEIVLAGGGRAVRVRIAYVGEVITGELVDDITVSEPPRVTLVQGLAKGVKFDDVVRHATELGVQRFVPLAADRSVVRLDAAKATARVERWQRIAAEAAKQSQQSAVPVVEPVTTIDGLAALLEGALVLVCWEDAAAANGIAEAIEEHAPAPGTECAVVVGPEGGLTEAEVETLTRAGGIMVTLGDTILRTETAGIVAPALVLHARGGLGAHRA